MGHGWMQTLQCSIRTLRSRVRIAPRDTQTFFLVQLSCLPSLSRCVDLLRRHGDAAVQSRRQLRPLDGDCAEPRPKRPRPNKKTRPQQGGRWTDKKLLLGRPVNLGNPSCFDPFVVLLRLQVFRIFCVLFCFSPIRLMKGADRGLKTCNLDGCVTVRKSW
jgi:hypothetical protein